MSASGGAIPSSASTATRRPRTPAEHDLRRGDHRQHERDVGDAARDGRRSGCAGRAAGRPGRGRRDAVHRHPARGRLQGREAAEVRGQPHARARVGPEPERRAARGDRGRRAAARPARGCGRARTGCWSARRPRCRTRSRRPTAAGSSCRRRPRPPRVAARPTASSAATHRAAPRTPTTSGTPATAMLSLTVNGSRDSGPASAALARGPAIATSALSAPRGVDRRDVRVEDLAGRELARRRSARAVRRPACGRAPQADRTAND